MFEKNLRLVYLLLIADIFLTITFIYTQGYNYNNILFVIMMKSMMLLLFVKSSGILIIYYINNYTRIFMNRYFYILFKLYIVLVIYINIIQIKEVI